MRIHHIGGATSDRYGFGDAGHYSSFPERVGRARFGDRDPHKYQRFERPSVGGPSIREEDWRLSSYIRRVDPPYERPYNSWKSGPLAWEREQRLDSWRREPSDIRGYEEWRRESSWHPRSSSPRLLGRDRHDLTLYRERSPGRDFPGRDINRRAAVHSSSRDLERGRIRNGPVLREGRFPLEPRNDMDPWDLGEKELEEAAILQMKLMAAQKDDELQGNSVMEKRQDTESASRSRETSQNFHLKKVRGGHTSNGKSVQNATNKVVEQQANKEATEKNETGEPKKASNITKGNSAEAEDALKKKNEEGSLVVKVGFEEVHMFAKHKIYDAAKAGPPKGLVGGASWYEQYMMNVNKRKQELESGLAIAPTSAPHGRPNGPRAPPQRGYASNSPTSLAVQPNSRLFQSLKPSSSCYLQAKEEAFKRSPSSLIDPNQFIEELSDDEDWETVGGLIRKPPLKREAESPMERPIKRGLLGAPPPPKSPTAVTSDPWQDPSRLTAKLPYPKSLSSVSFVPPTEKSFFRVELPSVAPRIYFSHKLGEPEDPVEAGPPQARIAPAIPLPQSDDRYPNWRHSGYSRSAGGPPNLRKYY